MDNAFSEKIECPNCGQCDLVELVDQDQSYACRVCSTTFTTESKALLESSTPVENPKSAHGLSHQHPFTKGRAATMGSMGKNKPVRPTAADQFIDLLFRFGKTFASVLAVLFLLAMIASMAASLWVSTASIEAPTYPDVVYADEWRDEEMPNPLDLRQRRLLEAAYSDRVSNIVKSHGLLNSDYVELMRLLSHYQDENRPSFLEGLDRVLRDRAIAAQKNPQNTPSPSEATARYISIYGATMQGHMFDEDKAENIRWAAIAVGFVACVMFFLMLMVSALLRIEKNTRK
ncbi:MAG: hypothetical protein ACK49N_04540 [Verrucomicrobiota bacterium]